MCAAAFALLALLASDPAPAAPVRAENERCDAESVPSPTVLKGARTDGRGRQSLRPRVSWTEPTEGQTGFRLLDPSEDAVVAAAAELLRWVATDAGTVGPSPSLVPGRGDGPAVRTDLGVRTELRFGFVRMLAEGMARVDASGTNDTATASMRLTPRGRVQLEAQPHERVHLGVEFCHRDERGLDALRSHTQGVAQVRFGF